MQLSSRILTALAVLILAVAVVAVRAGSPGTVDAATGTINALNVGTCYATSTDIFEVEDCDDGDGDGEYDVAGRDSLSEAGKLYATYAYDPKTAPDSPRGVLMYSNLIKVSISDSQRDKRTPVLLAVDGVDNAALIAANLVDDTGTTDIDESTVEPAEDSPLATIRGDFGGIKLDDPTFRWERRDANDPFVFTSTTQRTVNGITIDKKTSTDPIRPMFTVEGNDSPISLYGMFDADGDDTASDAEFKKLNTYLAIDEDVGPGRVGVTDGPGEVSPWFSVLVSIPADATVTLQYVVYETSEREVLVGGLKETADASQSNGYESESLDRYSPYFTETEGNATSALVVKARADGREIEQNLRLRETERFSGVYVGYLKLTDPNGTDGDEEDDNWGLDVGPATGMGDTIDDAAVLGVQSGPVVIEYRDTDGATRELNIEIDTVPPSVQIDIPAHESEGQDTSPEFAGDFNDDNSGLRDDTFRLYVDHTNDTNEDGVSEGSNLALDLRVDRVAQIKYGYVSTETTNGVVESTDDYSGYDTTPTFGVISHTDLFLSEDDELKVVEGDTHADGANLGGFADSERISFGVDDENGRFNNTIDYHALVVDVAGNIGFSDSDDEGPRFINNLGETPESDQEPERYNVLGWYARHVFYLDEKDPEIIEEQTVTGFYGEDDDGVPVPNRSGILVAFDRPVDADSIGPNTFSVTLDPVSAGTSGVSGDVIDVDADGRAVYLLLSEELASDATPVVDITTNEWVSDPAGNRLTGGEQTGFDAKDGIIPVLSVTLGGGSGSGEGDEGPTKLTMNSIVVSIDADEEINSTPSLVVLCSNIGWGDDNANGLSDLVDARSGDLEKSSATFDVDGPATYDCKYDDERQVKLVELQSYSRPGLTWEYQWVNLSDKDEKLNDGKLTVVAYARDRRSFESLDGEKKYNWGAATAEFRFDDTINEPGSVPGDSETVTESRPFVLLTYEDETTVSVDEFQIDGTVQEIASIGGNRFLYWPEALEIGSHTVTVDATDAAGNDRSDEIGFEVAERSPFNLKLIAGWNAVSLPANPVDNAIEGVFTEGVIDMVAGWDATDPEKPWSIATRMEDEWSTHEEFATLNKVHAQYGYWVHAQGFVTQRVQLVGGINRTDPEITPPDLVSIPTLAGWNFVGVIDQDGDQTEDNFGETLANGVDDDGNDVMVEAGDYLGNNKRAYTWDAIRSEFQILEDGDYIDIGDGIWVYYGGGIAP